MICQADLWQWIASNLRHITMLESSAFQRPGYARTDLCIQNTAIARGQALPTVEPDGVVQCPVALGRLVGVISHETPSPGAVEGYSHPS
jgi:hypothetical protein